ncbi:MAG: adenylosuccinate synthetase [Fimbriimonadaceae bacterium]
MATDYLIDGKSLGHMPYTLEEWDQVEAVFETMPGWSEDISSAKSWDDLPETVQNYIQFIEKFTDTPAAILSIGPDRDQTIILRPELIWG